MGLRAWASASVMLSRERGGEMVSGVASGSSVFVAEASGVRSKMITDSKTAILELVENIANSFTGKQAAQGPDLGNTVPIGKELHVGYKLM